MNFKNHIDNNINLDNIRNEISKHKIESFLVGGYVRDMILSRECKDIDIMTIGEPYKLVDSISKINGLSNVKIFFNITRKCCYRNGRIIC